jgi:Domain of unknown function (DUF4397)
VLSWTLNARPGNAYTAAGVGSGAAVRGVVIHDDLTAPPPGKGRVRVIQAASRAPHVTVSAQNGPVIARDATFATTTGYETVPAGVWPVRAVADGSSLQVTSTVRVPAGSVTSVLLLDAKARGITLRAVVDSAAAGTMPQGAVPAGAGGNARDSAALSLDTSADGVPSALGGVLALLVLSLLAMITAAPAVRHRARPVSGVAGPVARRGRRESGRHRAPHGARESRVARARS